MTLKQIVERLHVIEEAESWCLRCDRPMYDPRLRGPLRTLILDIERELLKQGQL